MFPDIIYRDTACALDEWLKILKYLNPYYSKGMLFDSVWEDVSSLVGKEAAADTLIGNCTTARPASRSNSS